MVRAVACWIMAMLLGAVSAQESNPAFEVASVKPAAAQRPTRRTRASFEITLPLKSLVAYAYGLSTTQVLGGAPWTRSQPFEVRAKFPALPAGISAPDQTSQMLRRLLADRFGLRVREEERVLPRFALRIKSPGRRAPGLLAADSRCVQARERAARGEKPDRLAVTVGLRCGIWLSRSPESITWTSDATDMNTLVKNIEFVSMRPVVDQTGIKGYFGLKVTMGGDQHPLSLPPAMGDAAGPGGPSLSEALAKDLNFALVSERGPVRVVVIEHAAQPTPN